jgi:hypothetical protein
MLKDHMLRFRVTFAHAAELRRVLEEEVRRGVMLVKVEPPPDLELFARIIIEIASPGGAIVFPSEVVSVLPTVGVAVAIPPDKVAEAQGLLALTPDGQRGEAVHEIVVEGAPAGATAAGAAAQMARMTFAEKVQIALHGSRDDRAAIVRDQNKQLHPFVLRSPNVTPEEIAGWAANPQMSPDFLKQIAERKEWISRPAIAVALAKNPKAPAEIAVRAVEYVPLEMLRQMAKGVGALPHVVQAARKKVLPR